MDDKKLKITFHGGARSVTGSNFLIENDTQKILVDCGLFQGSQIGDEKNRNAFPYDPRSIDILFVTHAHIDHIGRIPLLVKEGFAGKIYSTFPTRDISELMLLDSMRVLGNEAREKGLDPIYEEKDVKRAMSLWQGVEYHQSVDIDSAFSALFRDSGHVLGSGMVEFSYHNKKMVFTGDLGNSPAPLLHDTELLSGVDYLVMESVYGDRNHEDRDERRKKLEEVIEETIAKKGALVIPAFSLERTQDLLFEINNLVENKKIPQVPVFLDSPLAIKVTDIYKEYERYFNKKTKDIIQSGDDIFNFPQLTFTLDTQDSIAIKDTPNPKIIIAGSGMSNGGRIVHHENRHLWDPNSTILLVGYQAVGTRGRELEEGARTVHIFDKEIPVKARIAHIRGYSAHKDSDNLVSFVEAVAPDLKKVFVVLGEPKSAMFLAQRIKDYFNIETSVPEEGEVVVLDFS